MSEVDLNIMGALEAALEHELQKRKPTRLLAVLDEAWCEAGYAPGSWTDILYGPVEREEAETLRVSARSRRHRNKLRADARAILEGYSVLAAAGVYDYRAASEARRQFWLSLQVAGGESSGSSDLAKAHGAPRATGVEDSRGLPAARLSSTERPEE